LWSKFEQIPSRLQTVGACTWHYRYSTTSTVPCSVWVKRLHMCQGCPSRFMARIWTRPQMVWVISWHYWYSKASYRSQFHSGKSVTLSAKAASTSLCANYRYPEHEYRQNVPILATGMMARVFPVELSIGFQSTWICGKVLCNATAQKFQSSVWGGSLRGTQTVSVRCKMVGSIPPPWRIKVYMLL
jgi:hypothetical protein